MPPVLSCESLVCHRPHWTKDRPSLVDDLSLAFEPGTLTSLFGPDGCGKGLLLNLLGLLEPPDRGTIQVLDHLPLQMSDGDRCELRNELFGFLFDSPCLLPSFSVAENVAMPLFRICGGDARSARERTMEVLDFCGLRKDEGTLSGRLDASAQSRTALARALVHRPAILIAISPRDPMGLFPLVREVTRELGICTLWAAEKPTPEADCFLSMRSGRLQVEALQ
jgi:lipoprotein-releasing system ATP-binding protein